MEFNYFDCGCGVYLNWDKIRKQHCAKNDKAKHDDEKYVYLWGVFCPICKTLNLIRDYDFWKKEDFVKTFLEYGETTNTNSIKKFVEVFNIKEDDIKQIKIVDEEELK